MSITSLELKRQGAETVVQSSLKAGPMQKCFPEMAVVVRGPDCCDKPGKWEENNLSLPTFQTLDSNFHYLNWNLQDSLMIWALRVRFLGYRVGDGNISNQDLGDQQRTASTSIFKRETGSLTLSLIVPFMPSFSGLFL